MSRCECQSETAKWNIQIFLEVQMNPVSSKGHAQYVPNFVSEGTVPADVVVTELASSLGLISIEYITLR
jgi:hypothetical protein